MAADSNRDPGRRAAPRWTLSDRLISYLDPERGLQRLRARRTEALLGGYKGARRNRRGTEEWRPGGGSANADQLPDLPELRERSRDLMRDAPLALGAVNTNCTNVIGTGLAVQPKIDAKFLGLTPEQAAEKQAQAKREFELWARSPTCDVTNTQNFYALQDLAFRSMLENGDVLALTPAIARPGVPYKLKVQLIEADRLCNPQSKGDTPTLAGGVELDAYGAPVAYHIMRSHPGDIGRIVREWDRVPAFGAQTGRRNVLHVYKRIRVGQVRGMPYLAPVIELIKQISTYSEAEITAAVVSSLFTVFVRTQDGSGLVQEVSGGAGSGADPYDPKKFKLGPGAALALADGDTVEFANPTRPNPSFDPFMLAVLRQFGVALELPLEILIKHFTSSYTAARGAFLEAWKYFKVRRADFAAAFCQPLYELVMDEAVAIGRFAAPGYFRDPAIRAAYLGSEWVGDGPGSVDPLKEVNAAKERVALGISTREKESMAFDGSNFEDNAAQLHREAKAMAGLPVAASSNSAQPPQPPEPGMPPEDAALPEDDQ